MLEAQRLAVSWDGVIDLLVALQARWRDGEMAKYSGRQIVALRDGEMARYTHMHMHMQQAHICTHAHLQVRVVADDGMVLSILPLAPYYLTTLTIFATAGVLQSYL